MDWTETAPREHDRSRLRYASDCTDEEWAVVRPFFARTSRGATPAQAQGSDPVGCDPVYRIDGVPMGAMPKDFPPFTTVQYHFYRMRDNGLLDVINTVLIALVRVSEGHTPASTAGVIDSQSVKTTEAGEPRGYDAGKKIKPVLSFVEGARRRRCRYWLTT